MKETEKKRADSVHRPTSTMTKCKTLAEIELRNADDGHLQTQTLDGPPTSNNNKIAENGFRVSIDGGVKPEGTASDTEVDVGITLAQLSKKKVNSGGAGKRARTNARTNATTTAQQQLASESEGADLTSSIGNDDGTSQSNVVVVGRKEESDFSVGEFVWGKVKTYPWWPGRVYDPSDASETAVNHKPQDGRHLLVAFFGDATFGWCDPSQLKPFVENFVEMSGRSSSREFVTAVEEATTEFARLVKVEMMMGSGEAIEEEKENDDDHVVNAGIKEGVKPPRDGVRLYAVDGFQPKQVVSDLRRLGMSVNAVDLLKKGMLRSQVSVICRGRDEEMLVVGRCSERQDADEGGEKNGNGNFTGPPVEDVADGEELDQSETGAIPGSEHKTLSSSKRKSKSITEILDRATNVTKEVTSDEEDDNDDDDDGKGKGKDQSRLKPRKNKRRRVGTLCKEADEIKDVDAKLAGQSSNRKNNRLVLKDSEDHAATTTPTPSRQSERLKGAWKLGNDRAIEPKSQKQKEKKRDDSPPPSPVGTVEVVEIVSDPRERKKSKYLSPPFTNIQYPQRISTLLKAFALETGGISNPANTTGEGAASSSTQLASSAADAESSGQEAAKETRSRKNETHLSAQHATPNTGKKNPKMSVLSPDSILSQVQSAALIAKPSDDNAGGVAAAVRSGSRPTKSLYRRIRENPEETKAPTCDRIKESAVAHVEKQADAGDVKESMVTDTDAEKQANAGNGTVGKELKSTKKQGGNPSGKKNQGQDTSTKKQASAVDTESRGKNLSAKKMSAAESQGKNPSAKKKQTNAVVKERPSSKPDGHVIDDKSSSLNVGVGAGAALSLKYPTDFPLPSESDLNAIFRGFGSLEESKTQVFQHSSSAKVVFLNCSDAKAAMQHCKEGNPFGSAAVTYRVRNLRASPSLVAAADAPLGNGNPDVLPPTGNSSVKTKSSTSKKKRAAPVVALLEADEGLKCVKQKLEEMTTMVGNADGKVTVEMKSTLEAEMKVLLEKVRVLPVS